MTTLTYPSARFPGPPSVSLELPEGWVPLEAPEAALAATLARSGPCAPTVLVVIESAPAGATVHDGIDRMGRLAVANGGEASDPYAAQVGELSFLGCDSTWPDPDVDAVLQCNLFHLVQTQGPDAPGHLVRLTGAVGGADVEQDYELVRRVLLTARVTPWTAGEDVGGASAR